MTSETPDPQSWLPVDLEPVALRLARVDECVFQLGDLVSNWSFEGPLQLRQVRRGSRAETVLQGIRPVPPLVPLLFSEAVNHLRAALDNTVWYMVEREQGPVRTSAQLVAMPICRDEPNFRRWTEQRKKAGLRAFTEDAVLGRRVRSLQPFVDSTTTVQSMRPLLAALMKDTVEEAHPLLLLQGYSNGDKHRSIRVAVARTTSSRDDEPLARQDLTFRELQVGDVLAQTTWGDPVVWESSTAALIKRPQPYAALVSPVQELSSMHRYVAQVAMPILVTGFELPRSVPARVDLGDNGKTDRQRLQDGQWDDAKSRLDALAAERFREAMSRELQFPEVTDEPPEIS